MLSCVPVAANHHVLLHNHQFLLRRTSTTNRSCFLYEVGSSRYLLYLPLLSAFPKKRDVLDLRVLEKVVLVRLLQAEHQYDSSSK